MISAFENKVDQEQLATFDQDPKEFLYSCACEAIIIRDYNTEFWLSPEASM